jgi:hypothetical protein
VKLIPNTEKEGSQRRLHVPTVMNMELQLVGVSGTPKRGEEGREQGGASPVYSVATEHPEKPASIDESEPIEEGTESTIQDVRHECSEPGAKASHSTKFKGIIGPLDDILDHLGWDVGKSQKGRVGYNKEK